MARDFTLCLAGGNLPDCEAWTGTLRGSWSTSGLSSAQTICAEAAQRQPQHLKILTRLASLGIGS